MHPAASLIATIPLCALIALSISTVPPNPSATASSFSARNLGPVNDPGDNATSYSSCLRVVPADARIDTYGNATSSGVEAVFSNGSRLDFPYASCVKPIHPDIYPFILAIGSSPEFIAAENGSLFSYYDFGTFSYMYEGLNYTQSSFFLYSGALVDVCGSYMPWFTESMIVAVPFNSTTDGFNFSKMLILPGGYGPVATCTVTATITSSNNTTAVANSTPRSSTGYASNSTVNATSFKTAAGTGSSFPLGLVSTAVVVVVLAGLTMVFVLAKSRSPGEAPS